LEQAVRFRHIIIALLFLSACGDQDPSKGSKNPIVDVGVVDMGPDLAPDVGPDGIPLRVGTFNVRRFFDTVCQSNACASGDYELQLSTAEFDFKAQKLATAIDAMDVDVISLQEVETQAVLDGLMSKLQTPYTIAKIAETGGTASLDVAVLSKGTLIETRNHKDVPLKRPDGSNTSFAREFFEVHIDLNGHRVVVFAAHFRSQRDDDPGRRFAEAEAAGLIVHATAAEFPNALVVLAGDLNDTPESDPIQALLAAGGLTLLTQPGLWTYGSFSSTEQIDQLIMANSSSIWVDEGMPVAFDDGSGSYGGSDHRALAATFRFPE